jgi:hypothetical protein
VGVKALELRSLVLAFTAQIGGWKNCRMDQAGADCWVLLDLSGERPQKWTAISGSKRTGSAHDLFKFGVVERDLVVIPIPPKR